MATTTNAGHRSIQKSMAEARFARIQPQITIFASPIHYECMRIEIRELLRTVMTTTSNEGFFMNKMSFVHLFEMVMIFYFHSRGILNKSRNGGWIIHLEKEMIFISIIELTIRVKITKNLRCRWIYPVLMVDCTLKIFLIESILLKTFSLFEYFRRKSGKTRGI